MSMTLMYRLTWPSWTGKYDTPCFETTVNLAPNCNQSQTHSSFSSFGRRPPQSLQRSPISGKSHTLATKILATEHLISFSVLRPLTSRWLNATNMICLSIPITGKWKSWKKLKLIRWRAASLGGAWHSNYSWPVPGFLMHFFFNFLLEIWRLTGITKANWSSTFTGIFHSDNWWTWRWSSFNLIHNQPIGQI